MSKQRHIKKDLTGRSIVPLTVPGDMRVRIRSLSDKARLSDADIMRLAIDRGLATVEKMFETADVKAA